MSNTILSESPSLTAQDGVQHAPALEPNQLPPDAPAIILEACRIVLKSGNEPLFRRLLDIGSAIEQLQQQR